MSDETNDTTETLNEIEQALEKGADIEDPEFAAKMEKLKRSLGVSDSSSGMPTLEVDGSKVDWSDYDLDPRFAHLYPKARLQPTDEGPQWFVDIVEFKALKGRLDETKPSSKDSESISRMITQMVNGPDGWRLQSPVVPVNSNYGLVTLQRIFPIVLPTPNLLKTQEEVAATVTQPTEEELAAMEKQALDWVNGVGIAPEPPATPADASTPPSLEDHIEHAGNPTVEA